MKPRINIKVSVYRSHAHTLQYLIVDIFVTRGVGTFSKVGGLKSYWQIIKCMPILCEAHMPACQI